MFAGPLSPGVGNLIVKSCGTNISANIHHFHHNKMTIKLHHTMTIKLHQTIRLNHMWRLVIVIYTVFVFVIQMARHQGGTLVDKGLSNAIQFVLQQKSGEDLQILVLNFRTNFERVLDFYIADNHVLCSLCIYLLVEYWVNSSK